MRPGRIQPPAQIRKIERARIKTFRHRRTRRIYKAYLTDVVHQLELIQTRNGGGRRVVSAEVLYRDFDEVSVCGYCGAHHARGSVPSDRHKRVPVQASVEV